MATGPRFNPFRPGSIVTPGIFKGRGAELIAIERSLEQARGSNPRHFIIEGERGIGKSSLLLFARMLARGVLPLHTGARAYNFLCLEVELTTNTTDIEIVEMLGKTLRRELTRAGEFKTIAKHVLDFVTSWKILGVEYKKDKSFLDPIEAIDDFALAISDLMACSGHILDGVFILVDEADKPDAHTAKLGELVKHLTERLTKIGCDKCCIGLAGLPVLIPKLRASHESAPRLFETLTLGALSMEDREEVIRAGLDEANSKNTIPTNIEPDAMRMLAHLSEGYPHFLQEFSYAPFEASEEGTIKHQDVNWAIYKEGGAMHQLGKRYFEAIYYEKISSPDYRKVLQAMAAKSDQWIPRQEIIRMSKIKESQVNNALNTLKARNIILNNEERKGEYRLPTKSLAVWLNILGERADQVLMNL